MTKYLVLVEVDIDEKDVKKSILPFSQSLVRTVAGIGDVGEHVTVEKALNLEFIERIEGVQVWEVDEDVGGDPLPTVAVVQDKFSAGQHVDVILLPSDSSKALQGNRLRRLTAVIRRGE